MCVFVRRSRTSKQLPDIGFCGHLLCTFSNLFLDSICATMKCYFSGFYTPLLKGFISVRALEGLMLLNIEGNAQLNKAAIYDFFLSLEDKTGKLDFWGKSAEAEVAKMRFSA